MKSEIENKILEATCSKSLQTAILKSKFEISDFDLLILTYRHAPDYDTRLNLLHLIKDNSKDSATKERAIKCIAFETEKLRRFIESEENCVFEVKIKETPNTWEERYLAKTFNGALKKVEYFCQYYECSKMDINSRFGIVKRKVIDEIKLEDFGEDWRGEATYNGKSTLLNVLYEDLKTEILNDGVKCEFDKCDCGNCKQPCFTSKMPKLPQFLKNLDIVCFNDYYGMKQYGVVFVFDINNNDSDDCAYCIPLDKERICNRTIKSKKAFFEKLISGLHEHVEYPRIDVIKATDLPNDVQKAYQTLMRLNERFNKA